MAATATQITARNVNVQTDGEEIEDAQKSTAMWQVRGDALYTVRVNAFVSMH